MQWVLTHTYTYMTSLRMHMHLVTAAPIRAYLEKNKAASKPKKKGDFPHINHDVRAHTASCTCLCRHATDAFECRWHFLSCGSGFSTTSQKMAGESLILAVCTILWLDTSYGLFKVMACSKLWQVQSYGLFEVMAAQTL